MAANEHSEENRLRPNTFQTPNLIVDRLMALLEDGELRVVMFACRHIYGWRETNFSGSAVLSLSVFEHGQRGGGGCGLSRQAIVTALANLERFGLMKRLGEATQKGQRWALVDDDRLIDWQALEERAANRQYKRRRAGRVVKPLDHQSSHLTSSQAARPPVKSLDQGWSSDLTTSSQATRPPVVKPLDHIETHIETQNQKPISETQQQQAPASLPTAAQPAAPAAGGVGGGEQPVEDDDLTFILPEVRKLHLSAEAQKRLLERGAQTALAIAFAATAPGVRNPAGLAVKLMANGGPSDADLERAALALELRTLDPHELGSQQRRRAYARFMEQTAEQVDEDEPVPPVVPEPEPEEAVPEQAVAQAPADNGLDYRPGKGVLTLRDWWQATINDINVRRSHRLLPVVPLRYADGVLTVQVKLAEFHWWQRYADMVSETLHKVCGEAIRVVPVLSEADRAAQERFAKILASKGIKPVEASRPAPSAPEPLGAVVARVVVKADEPAQPVAGPDEPPDTPQAETSPAPSDERAEPVAIEEPVQCQAEPAPAAPEPPVEPVAAENPAPLPSELDPADLPGLWQQVVDYLNERQVTFVMPEVSRLEVVGYADGVVMLRAATWPDYQRLEQRRMSLGYVEAVLRTEAEQPLQIRLLPPDQTAEQVV